MREEQRQSPQQKGGQASMQPDHGDVSAAEVEHFIRGIDFPCSKEDLMQHAEEQGAPDEVLNLMEQFPEQEYGSAIDVSQGVSQVKH